MGKGTHMVERELTPQVSSNPHCVWHVCTLQCLHKCRKYSLEDESLTVRPWLTSDFQSSCLHCPLHTHTRCWDHSCVWSGQLLPYPPVFMCSFTVPILSSTLFFLRCSIQKTVWREPRDHCPQSEEGISCQRQAAWGSCRRRGRLCPGSTGGISCEGQVVRDGICPMDPSHIPWVHSGRYSLFLPLLSRQHGLQAGRLGSGNWGPYSLCTYDLAVSLVLGLLCLVSGIW